MAPCHFTWIALPKCFKCLSIRLPCWLYVKTVHNKNDVCMKTTKFYPMNSIPPLFVFEFTIWPGISLETYNKFSTPVNIFYTSLSVHSPKALSVLKSGVYNLQKKQNYSLEFTVSILMSVLYNFSNCQFTKSFLKKFFPYLSKIPQKNKIELFTPDLSLGYVCR